VKATIGICTLADFSVAKKSQQSCVPVLRWSCELWRTTKHTIVYPGLGPCYEIIALRPAFLLLKKRNIFTMGVS
jgi:hypothetical protein